MTSLPTGPGTYVLVIGVAQPLELSVGALGRLSLRAGYYLYVGSALGGLAARIGRHLRAAKRVLWHIDHLLAQGQVVEVWWRADAVRHECAWAEALRAWPAVVAHPAGFGASDCACRTHLFYSATRPAHGVFLAHVGDQGPAERLLLDGRDAVVATGP
ncbi:MAG: GIY-YIG nuclease family protein [Chloroflexota bacterium]